jgi:TRAP-type C4-dicarboxylate transport system permease small subunit
MSRQIERVLGALSRFLLAIAAAAALTMTALVVTASFMRYVVGTPFRFTEELVALLYVAMMFFTVPYGTFMRQHITVSMLVERAAPRSRHWLQALATLAIIAFAVWFTIEAYQFAAFSQEIGARSEQFDFLLWPWMALMPLAMTLVAVIACWQLVELLRAGPAAELAPTEIEGDKL